MVISPLMWPAKWLQCINAEWMAALSLHFFFSSLFYVKLPFSTFGLRCAPFNSDSQLFEVRWVSSVPSPTVAAQPLYMLGEYFPKTSHQYSPRFAFLKIPSPPLSVVLDSRHPTIHTYTHTHTHIYIYIYIHFLHASSCILQLDCWVIIIIIIIIFIIILIKDF